MDLKLPPLYRASVPVFLGVLDRLEATLTHAEAALGPLYPAALTRRPYEGMMPAAQQAATAVQFTLRIAFPLVGKRPPELRDPLDGPGLIARLAGAKERLRGLDPEDFTHSGRRVIRFQAGIAPHELPAEQFLHEFGLPNIYFHHAMTHVALKAAGVTLGKADFDGLHEYPPGFSLG